MGALPSAISLIGMPGAGKSTVGVLLAKATALDFVDTDLMIQAGEGRPLKVLLEELGRAAFCALEERYVLALDPCGKVVAPGGSVVYSVPALEHLRRHGPVVFLDVPLPVLAGRLGNLDRRGVVRSKGQTLGELYAERYPLYLAAASHRVPCGELSHDDIVAEIRVQLDC